MRLAGLAIVGAITVGLGCATLPPCPARGGPAWSEYSSEHFDLQTDMAAPAAKAVVTVMEDTRAAILGMVWGADAGPPERTRVIVFDSGEQLEVFAGAHVVGTYFRRSPFSPTMIFAGETVGGIEILEQHLAVELVFWLMPFAPVWYTEGIASFMQKTKYDRAQGRAFVGELSKVRLLTIQRQGPMNVDRLMDPPPTEQAVYSHWFSATSWLLVHYLLNHHEKAFRRFQMRLVAMEPSKQAWRAEFPELDPSTLEFKLQQYARATTYVVSSRAIAPWQGETRVRSMSDAEVHSMRAFLYSYVPPVSGKPQLDKARAELDEALSAPVPPIEALALAFYGRDAKNETARSALARRAVDTHPDSWLSWIMVAETSDPANPAHESALGRALDLAPDQRELLVRAAVAKARRERWDEAVVFSSRALRGRALGTELWTLHLTALAKTGYCAEAEQWATALVAALPARTSQPIAALWGTLKQTCVPAPPRTKPGAGPPPN